MIRDLVVYFLRQGCYSGNGDIAVLCAYLGQLQKVRAALKDLKIAVAVDERDAEQLARQEMDEEVEFEEVLVAKHVSWCSSMHYPVLAAPFTSCRFVSERSISSKARKQRSSSSRWFGTRAMWTLLLARSVSSR